VTHRCSNCSISWSQADTLLASTVMYDKQYPLIRQKWLNWSQTSASMASNCKTVHQLKKILWRYWTSFSTDYSSHPPHSVAQQFAQFSLDPKNLCSCLSVSSKCCLQSSLLLTHMRIHHVPFHVTRISKLFTAHITSIPLVTHMSAHDVSFDVTRICKLFSALITRIRPFPSMTANMLLQR